MNLTQLKTITEPTALSELTEAQLRDLQEALSHLGYPVGDVDGLLGPKTRNAWAEFKTDVFLGNPTLIGPEAIKMLQERVNALEANRDHDLSTKEGAIKAIQSQCKAMDIGLDPQIAYILATVEWETAKTFQPVKEAFWLSEDWRQRNLRYYPYYGRGYVQLTWKNNYEKYSQLLGVDLVNNPDLALNGHHALFILVHGFKTGTFTGRKISEFINSNHTDFVRARRCINGKDHAHDIEQLAERYLSNL